MARSCRFPPLKRPIVSRAASSFLVFPEFGGACRACGRARWAAASDCVDCSSFRAVGQLNLASAPSLELAFTVGHGGARKGSSASFGDATVSHLRDVAMLRFYRGGQV